MSIVKSASLVRNSLVKKTILTKNSSLQGIKPRFGSHQSQSDFQRNAIVYTVLGAGATGAVLAFVLDRNFIQSISK